MVRLYPDKSAKGQNLTDEVKITRKQNCRKIKALTHGGKLGQILFTDEQIFTGKSLQMRRVNGYCCKGSNNIHTVTNTFIFLINVLEPLFVVAFLCFYCVLDLIKQNHVDGTFRHSLLS